MLFQESGKLKFAAKTIGRFLAAEARRVTDNLRKGAGRSSGTVDLFQVLIADGEEDGRH